MQPFAPNKTPSSACYNITWLHRWLITLATKSTGNLVFDAPARMVVRFENFLRDGARHHAPCCGKGQQIVVPAIFKAFSKNAGIGDRSGYLAVRSRVRNPILKNTMRYRVRELAPPGGEFSTPIPHSIF